jgi:hypothetical protein
LAVATDAGVGGAQLVFSLANVGTPFEQGEEPAGTSATRCGHRSPRHRQQPPAEEIDAVF